MNLYEEIYPKKSNHPSTLQPIKVIAKFFSSFSYKHLAPQASLLFVVKCKSSKFMPHLQKGIRDETRQIVRLQRMNAGVSPNLKSPLFSL